jgi:hypothetical protein
VPVARAALVAADGRWASPRTSSVRAALRRPRLLGRPLSVASAMIGSVVLGW